MYTSTVSEYIFEFPIEKMFASLQQKECNESKVNSYFILEAAKRVDYHYYDDYENKTIEEILGQNVPKCCKERGYISQNFRKVSKI